MKQSTTIKSKLSLLSTVKTIMKTFTNPTTRGGSSYSSRKVLGTILERTASDISMETTRTSLITIADSDCYTDDIFVSSFSSLPTDLDDFEEFLSEQEKKEKEDNNAAAAKKHSNKGSSSVGFGTVQIREYPICVGDNPAVSKGPPITIGWDHQNEETVCINQYEDIRVNVRRNYKQLKMKSIHREDKLRNVGYSREDIRCVVKKVNIARRKRMETNSVVESDHLHEFIDTISRKTKNIATFGAKKRKERKYLEQVEQCFQHRDAAAAASSGASAAGTATATVAN